MIARSALCALAAGLLLPHGLPVLPGWSAWWLLPAALFGAALGRPFGAALAAAIFGAAWTLAAAQHGVTARLAAADEGETLRVTGTVAALPQRKVEVLRLVLAVDELAGRRGPLPRRVQLAWYQPPAAIPPGAACRLYVRLQRPHGARNPGTFDFERWAFANRLDALGYVVAHPANECRASTASGAVDRGRERLARAIAASVAVPATAAVLSALAVGERADMSDAQWRVLRDTGTAHLISISGLHIAMVAVLGFGIARFAWSSAPGLVRRAPAPHAGAAGAVIAAAVYAVLAGFTVPTQRTLFMLVLVLIARWRGRALLDGDTFLLAFVMILLADPLASLTASFWWSFGAVGALLLFAAGARRRGRWWRWGGVHFGLAIALVPLLAFSLQAIAVASPIANLLAVPWVTLVVVPLVLLGGLLWLIGVPGGEACWRVAAGQWELLNALLERIVAVVPPVWLPARPTLTAALLAAAGIVLWCVPLCASRRWLAALLVLQLWRPAPQLAAGRFRLHVLDVGQGLATVVMTRTHVLVYDTGPRWRGGGDAGAAIVAPFLRGLGWHRLDALVVSHPDVDHAGGATTLAAEFAPAVTWRSPSQSDLPGARVCRAGIRWRWDGVDFALLHPGTAIEASDNDWSCVLRVSGPGGSALLPGDIGAAAERRLLASGAPTAADVLVVPHHGSASSSSEAFVAAVAPRHAVFTAGYRNRFGHPAAAVRARYGAHGSTSWATAETGALEFDFGPRPALPRAFRAATRRYWHWQP